MTFIKKYIFSTILTFLSVLIMLLVLTILYYYNLIKLGAYNILKLISLIFSTLISSIYLGTKTKQKGYLEGIKLALIIITLFIIPTIILSNFNIKILIYYLIILITSSLGSMIGINIKKKN